MKLVVFSVLAALLVPATASAQDSLQAKARIVETDAGASYTVGTPITVEIEARHALGGVALLPDPLGLPAALGERRRLRQHERRREGDLDVDVYRLELVPFMAGLVEIPPLPLAVGSTVTETEPLLVEVDQARPPRNPIHEAVMERVRPNSRLEPWGGARAA